MKKLSISLLMCTLLSASISQCDHILLTSPIVEFVDGTNLGINDSVINLMLQVRGHIKKLLFGKKLPSGSFEGQFNFDGHMCSIRMLKTLETKYEAEFNQKQTQYRSANDHKKLDELQAWYKQIKLKLQAIFEIVKNEFKGKITPFAKNARGAKNQMLKLIEESCTKRKRFDSLLLKWADADEHTEMIFFDNTIKTFRDLDQFCIDLANFLGDLMHSCPKAMAQYEQAKKAWDEAHKQ